MAVSSVVIFFFKSLARLRKKKMATTVWPGVRLLEMLDNIVEGKRDGFEGLHGTKMTTEGVHFDTLYNNPYYNYFCDVSNDGGFSLVLHPDVKPFAEALRKQSVMQHCWFGHNGDSVTGITAAVVAERYDKFLNNELPKQGSLSSRPPRPPQQNVGKPGAKRGREQ